MKGGVAAVFRFTAGAVVVALLAIGIPLATNFEVAPAYFAIGGAGLLLSALFGAFPDGRPGDSPPTRLPFRELIRDRVPALILLATGVAGIVLAAAVMLMAAAMAVVGTLVAILTGASPAWSVDGHLLFNGFFLSNLIGVFIGFAIGRSIWWDALKGYLAGDLERAAASYQIADAYLRFVKVYDEAERGALV